MSNVELGVIVLRFLLNWTTRFLLAGIVVYSCWIPIQNYNFWFSWHVILCTLGLFPLMAEALMLFPSDELWSRQLTRTQKYIVHGVLITLGTILISAGCIDTFYYIEEGYHLYTAHGITGLVAMILMLLSIVSGRLVTYSPKLNQITRPIVIKFLHNSSGMLGYVIGVVSLGFAFYTEWFKYYTSEESRLAALIATILATAWTLNAALVSGYQQIKTLLQ